MLILNCLATKEKPLPNSSKNFCRFVIKADSNVLSLPSMFSGKSKNSNTYGSLTKSFGLITAGKHVLSLFSCVDKSL